MGRLAQGIGTRMKEGTDTIFWIKRNHVPAGKKVTYANAICCSFPLKDDPYCVRLTVGGNKLDYNGDSSAPAPSFIDSKLIFNSTISTKGAKFITTDIKDYFLNNPMENFKYMKIPLWWFPQDVIDQYGIMSIVEPDGFVYVEIRKRNVRPQTSGPYCIQSSSYIHETSWLRTTTLQSRNLET